MNAVISTVLIIRLKLLKRVMKYKKDVAPNKYKIPVAKLKEIRILTLTLLTWTKWRAPTNASKWRMGFNLAFKGLRKPQNYRNRYPANVDKMVGSCQC
jgi:hypothetical protein